MEGPVVTVALTWVVPAGTLANKSLIARTIFLRAGSNTRGAVASELPEASSSSIFTVASVVAVFCSAIPVNCVADAL